MSCFDEPVSIHTEQIEQSTQSLNMAYITLLFSVCCGIVPLGCVDVGEKHSIHSFIHSFIHSYTFLFTFVPMHNLSFICVGVIKYTPQYFTLLALFITGQRGWATQMWSISNPL